MSDNTCCYDHCTRTFSGVYPFCRLHYDQLPADIRRALAKYKDAKARHSDGVAPEFLQACRDGIDALRLKINGQRGMRVHPADISRKF